MEEDDDDDDDEHCQFKIFAFSQSRIAGFGSKNMLVITPSIW
jgi:hypothetical protein